MISQTRKSYCQSRLQSLMLLCLESMAFTSTTKKEPNEKGGVSPMAGDAKGVKKSKMNTLMEMTTPEPDSVIGDEQKSYLPRSLI